ncbi:rh50 isoform b [Anaeramoeba ignava]|uniref:Rh50 isoform b n=1 Tax=Anaeramoeba ignava TaxID=1746090 RepID=A0A9Q0LPD4_ANAIG|nr:rh50 isoform b [Anaeramoeba ignava]
MEKEKQQQKQKHYGFLLLTIIFEVAMLVIYGLWMDYDTSYNQDSGETDERVDLFYYFFIDVAIMIFVGFGFLMVFLKRYGYSSAGYTYFISAVAFQWAIVTNSFFAQANDSSWGKVALNLEVMIEGLYAAAAVLISFGAVLGKTTPTQLLIMTFFELIFYSLNYYIGFLKVQAVDIGGSMIIHAFGAFFGVSVTTVLTSRKETKDHKLNGSSYTSDLFSLLGSIFLWIFWPSFNAALAEPGAQYRAVINTTLSLTASCLMAFVVSSIFHHGKFDMVDIQNATLAGGVAVGSSADLVINPVGAFSCGLAGGFVSTLGFSYFASKITKIFGIQDTCGVQFLHGWPGIIGGIASSIAIARAKNHRDPYLDEKAFHDFFPRGDDQPQIQFAALVITLGIAIGGGIITGAILRLTTKNAKKPFDDSEYWILPTGENEIGKKEMEMKKIESEKFEKDGEKDLD